jgi:hypothetical protein
MSAGSVEVLLTVLLVVLLVVVMVVVLVVLLVSPWSKMITFEELLELGLVALDGVSLRFCGVNTIVPGC